MSERSSALTLVLLIVGCLAVAGAGGALTRASVDSWYATLVKPSLTPPNWVFAPVWTVLYVLMAVSAWLVLRAQGLAAAATQMSLFLVQLCLNLLWSALFFGLQMPGLALVEILFLLAAILATALAFRPVSHTAFLLLLPYLAWVSFAAFLNLRIWQLNGRVF